MKVIIRQEVLRGLRVSNGWTQEKLAEVANVHPRTIQRIEAKGDASMRSLDALATALGVESTSLMQAESGKHVIDRRRFDMNNLPHEEKLKARKLVQKAEKPGVSLFNEWVAWLIFLTGGVLTIIVLLIVEANLGRSAILYVLIPGSATGLLFMLIGAFGLHSIKQNRSTGDFGFSGKN
jgi:transcriptional regulator with XRE-family HTH domain